MNWCILIPLIVGIICAILGYLLRKFLGHENSDECNQKIAKIEAELEACRRSKTNLESDLKSTKATLDSSSLLAVTKTTATAKTVSLTPEKILTTATTAKPSTVLSIFNVDDAKAALGKKIKENDLTVVEGIGPKIQGLFHAHDIKTWKALSECSVEKCQTVLDSGGERYKIHRPGTWPKQAEMAHKGKWKDLSEWQDKLDGGK